METERIKELLALMEQHGLAELELDEGTFHIKLKKGAPAPLAVGPAAAPVPGTPTAALARDAMSPAAPLPAPRPDEARPDDAQKIRCPCVGTFFRAPAPDADPFVEVGDPVEPETVVCIVEAMKVMNEVKAECHGTVEKILVENGKPVEYDQELFLITP